MSVLDDAMANLAPGVRERIEAGFKRMSVQQLMQKNEELRRKTEELRRTRTTRSSDALDKEALAHLIEMRILDEYVARTFP